MSEAFKAIFLDFDGVILPLPENREVKEDLRPSTDAIIHLNVLVQLTGAKVIVSSAWRVGKSVEDLQALLSGWGFKGKVVGKTRDSKEGDRGQEILDWVDEADVDQFVVLDDEGTDLEELSKNLVHVKSDVGIQWHDVQEAARILMGVPQ